MLRRCLSDSWIVRLYGLDVGTKPLFFVAVDHLLDLYETDRHIAILTEKHAQAENNTTFPLPFMLVFNNLSILQPGLCI